MFMTKSNSSFVEKKKCDDSSTKFHCNKHSKSIFKGSKYLLAEIFASLLKLAFLTMDYRSKKKCTSICGTNSF